MNSRFKDYFQTNILPEFNALQSERIKTRNSIAFTYMLIILGHLVMAFFINMNYFVGVILYILISVLFYWISIKSIFVAIYANTIPLIVLISLADMNDERFFMGFLITFMILLSMYTIYLVKDKLKEKCANKIKQSCMNLTAQFIDQDLKYSMDLVSKFLTIAEEEKEKMENDYDLNNPKKDDWGEAKEKFVNERLSNFISGNILSENFLISYSSNLEEVASKLNNNSEVLIENKDYVYGNYQGFPLMACEVRATNKNGGRNKKTLFDGTVFIKDYPKGSNGSELFIKKRGFSFFRFNKLNIKTNVAEFDDKYSVFGAGEGFAQMVLSKDIVSGILKYVPDNKNVSFVIYDNKIFIFVSKSKICIEPKIFGNSLKYDELLECYTNLQFGISLLNIFK